MTRRRSRLSPVERALQRDTFVRIVAGFYPQKLRSLAEDLLKAPEEDRLTIMRRWLREHHLDEPWILQRLDLLFAVTAHASPSAAALDEARRAMAQEAITLALDEALAGGRAAERPIWPNPLRESRAQFLGRAAATYDSVRRKRESTGANRPHKKTEVDTHLGWLAQYQVGGESFGAIGRHNPYPDPERARSTIPSATVSAAVGQVAKDLDLTLRKRGRPGRPKKSSTA